MYHLCVQQIYSRNSEESALGPVEPLDVWRRSARDALPVRYVVRELAVSSREELSKSVILRFSTKCVSTKMVFH